MPNVIYYQLKHTMKNSNKTWSELCQRQRYCQEMRMPNICSTIKCIFVFQRSCCRFISWRIKMNIKLPYNNTPMSKLIHFSYTKIIDIDVKYILLFIGCKIFYVVDVSCFLFFHYLYLTLKLKNMHMIKTFNLQ